MTKHEAYEYWLMRYNKAKDYDDPHWDAEERVAHHRWLEAMEQAMEALKDTSVSVDSDTVKLRKGVKKFRAENYVIYYAPCEECANPDTYGTICVKCGACGRKFDDKGVLIDNE